MRFSVAVVSISIAELTAGLLGVLDAAAEIAGSTGGRAEPIVQHLGLGDLVANSVALGAFAITCCIAYLSLPERRFQEHLQLVAARFLATAIDKPHDFGNKWCPRIEDNRLAHHVIFTAFLRIGEIVDWKDHGLSDRELKECRFKFIAFCFCHGHDNKAVFGAATMSFLTLFLSFLFLFDAIDALSVPNAVATHVPAVLKIVYVVNFAVIGLVALLTLGRTISLWLMLRKVRWARNELKIQMRNDSQLGFTHAVEIIPSNR
jgi:hypothetical protein